MAEARAEVKAWEEETSRAQVLKTGFRGCSDFGFWILWDLASTYVLGWPCSSSLYFGISRSSGWLDLVVSKERSLSQFQN